MANRGEVWKVDLDPAKGTEIKKKRSCVVISTNHLNKWGHRFVVVPLTSKKANQIFPFEVPIFFRGKKGKALCDQIRTVDQSRLIKTKQGRLTSAEMDAIQEKLLATFDLWEYLKKRELV